MSPRTLFLLFISIVLALPACRDRSSVETQAGKKTGVSRAGGNLSGDEAGSGDAVMSEKSMDREEYDLRKKEFGTTMDLAMKAFREADIPGCMAALDVAESKLKNRSELHNLRGACWVEVRDFEKAREAFQKAEQMSPDHPSIAFNLAEMDFLTGRWEEAIGQFEVAVEKFATKQNGVRELAEFKMLLCHSQLGQIVEMKALLTKHRQQPQSPAYYYSEAAAALLKSDFPGFDSWRAKAREAFPDEKVLAPWQDTVNEFMMISKS